MARLKLSPNTVLIQVLQQCPTLLPRPVTKLLGEGTANIQTALAILVVCTHNRVLGPRSLGRISPVKPRQIFCGMQRHKVVDHIAQAVRQLLVG